MKYKKFRKILKESQKLNLYIKKKGEVYSEQIPVNETKQYDNYDVIPGSVVRDDSNTIHVDLKQPKKKKDESSGDDDINSMKQMLNSLKKERKKDKDEQTGTEQNRNRNDRRNNNVNRKPKPQANILQKFANETVKEAVKDKDTKLTE